MGIPEPPFGIHEFAPATPNPWSQSTAGFYYVDESTGTDNNNANGYPARPRKTIPQNLPAGAVVEVHGTYSNNHSSPNKIGGTGTAMNPIFIRGVSQANRAVVTNRWEIKASYLIMENLLFADADGNLSGGQLGSPTILAPAHYIALRDSEVTGNLGDGGVGVVSWENSFIDHIVIYRVKVHDNGDYHAAFDQDCHGILVGAYASYVWVLENEMYLNSGDGIQIGGRDTTNPPNHVYVGRNRSHQNKQTGFWVKNALDVFFSENEAYGHVPSGSSPGAGLGWQYDSDRVWFLFNNIHDNTIGIAGGSSDATSGSEIYVIGNTIRNTTSWGIEEWNLAASVFMINNTIYNVSGGIAADNNQALVIASNIISSVGSGNHAEVANSLAFRTTIHHNLFGSGSAKILWNATTYNSLGTFSSATGACGGCREGNPSFVNPLVGNFFLAPNSPAVNTGVIDSVYSTFLSLYGIDISKSADGSARPASSWDMGAFESF
jgi:hypothetical protein